MAPAMASRYQLPRFMEGSQAYEMPGTWAVVRCGVGNEIPCIAFNVRLLWAHYAPGLPCLYSPYGRYALLPLTVQPAYGLRYGSKRYRFRTERGIDPRDRPWGSASCKQRDRAALCGGNNWIRETHQQALLMPPVMTDANGGFNISTLYTCPSSSAQVYLTATQGNPGLTSGTNNAALAMMVALGSCGNLSASTHVTINEVTTVAAVWSLAQFMTAYDHVGASATNSVGIANSFAIAGVLASTDNGFSPGAAPATSTIPTSELNSLADVLASCINTAGGTAGDGSACGKLFSYTTPIGGTAPTDTIGAALNIALQPGVNVSSIFGLVTSSGPFQPTLTATPNDWTVALK